MKCMYVNIYIYVLITYIIYTHIYIQMYIYIYIMYSWNWHSPPEQVHSKKTEGIILQPLFFRGDLLSFSESTSTNLQVPCHTWQQKQCPNVIYWTWMNMGKFHGCFCLRAGIVLKKTPLTHAQEGHPFVFIYCISLTCHFLSTRPGIVNLWS